MGIAVADEHDQLAETVRGWAARAADAPDLLEAAAAQGLLGLHVPESHGGAGYGHVELAVTVEQLGYALAPGPLVPTLLASALLSLAPDTPAAKELLPRLVDGSTAATVALDAGDPVLAAADADVLILPVTSPDGDRVWAALDAGDLGIDDIGAGDSLDITRSVGRVTAEGTTIPENRILHHLDDQTVADVAATVLAAEAAGVAAWCQETATDYAKTREQFGRPIGQFQYVKHACADLLVLVEQARAAAWDAARALTDDHQRPLAAAVAAATAFDGAVTCALECIQILGGIGFTWEHDAHRYLRRATTLRQLVGSTPAHRRRVAEFAIDGTRRELALDLTGDEADRAREQVRAFLDELPEDGLEARVAMAEAGYLNPHWPKPWGRDASAVEQLVIDEEFAETGVERPRLIIGGWILPSIIAHGTPEQQERFVPPTLTGEITWCQMFSEPEAGSDLASLRTRAERVEGGWVLTGQKVWTSLARNADWSLALARTDPDAPKHEGITAFLVRMDADGLDIRPLREITGNDLFNEIWLDEVFVPDENVLGEVDNGWKVGRTTLANERVAMSSGSSMGSSVEQTLATMTDTGATDDPGLLERLGELVATGQVLSLLGFRTTLRQLSGVEPGAASSVRKLVGGRHAQDCAELALQALGPEGATTTDAAGQATYQFLQTQCLTIAGGTTAVQKNVIAERLLGLPRDPEPTT